MSKFLQTAALVVGAIAIATSLPGVGPAIAGAIGHAVGLSAATVSTIATASAAALSVASALSAHDPPPGASPATWQAVSS